jgi:hypothetical protein
LGTTNTSSSASSSDGADSIVGADDDDEAFVHLDNVENQIMASDSGQDEFSRLSADLAARCQAAKLDFSIVDEDDVSIGYARQVATVRIPCGRETRKLIAVRAEGVSKLLATQFESTIYLGRYEAILDRAKKRIEARVRPAGPLGLNSRIERWVQSLPDHERSSSRAIWPEGPSGLKLSLGLCTSDFRPFADVPRSLPLQTFAIEGVNATRHDDALSLLERVSNAAFFALDLSHSLPLQIGRARPEYVPALPARAKSQPLPLAFPQYEYDSDPISLYWYAKSARGMPLLQYLAFYQVLEFYFPTYSKREVGRKLQATLKDPSFRADRDVDITRILSIVGSSKGGAFGTEKEQLKATITECVEPSDLTDFFLVDEARKSFFAGAQKGLTTKRLNFSNPNLDIRSDVAELIYDIRCKIVHTKQGEATEEKLLLPLSPEADLLRRNIELIQFVAQKAIVAASTPIKTAN